MVFQTYISPTFKSTLFDPICPASLDSRRPNHETRSLSPQPSENPEFCLQKKSRGIPGPRVLSRNFEYQPKGPKTFRETRDSHLEAKPKETRSYSVVPKSQSDSVTSDGSQLGRQSLSSRRRSNRIEEVGYLTYTEDTKAHQDHLAKLRKNCFEGLNWQLHEQDWKKNNEKKGPNHKEPLGILPICLTQAQRLKESKESIREGLIRQMEEKRALSLIEKRANNAERESWILENRANFQRTSKGKSQCSASVMGTPVKEAPRGRTEANQMTPEQNKKTTSNYTGLAFRELSFGKNDNLFCRNNLPENEVYEDRPKKKELDAKRPERDFVIKMEEQMKQKERQEEKERAGKNKEMAEELRRQMAEKASRKNRISRENKENDRSDYFLVIRQKDNVRICEFGLILGSFYREQELKRKIQDFSERRTDRERMLAAQKRSKQAEKEENAVFVKNAVLGENLRMAQERQKEFVRIASGKLMKRDERSSKGRKS
jgi:hypothetical protein